MSDCESAGQDLLKLVEGLLWLALPHIMVDGKLVATSVGLQKVVWRAKCYNLAVDHNSNLITELLRLVHAMSCENNT